MTNFHVGQKVVCIEARNSPKLTKGAVYTVLFVNNSKAISALDGKMSKGGLLLCEVEAKSLGFDCRRFRPLITRKTDISIFKSMLTPKTEQVDA